MNKNSITDDFNTQVQCEEVYVTDTEANEEMADTDRRVIDLTPSWETAVNICIMVLQNPEAGQEAIETCKQELLRLARHVDSLQKGYERLLLSGFNPHWVV
jgi:hypothetical protein